MTSNKKPDFFIVGAPKSGTTALDHYLAAHPDVFVARKEMHFFGSDLEFGPQLQLYRHYPDEYFAQFDGWKGQARAGEASVWYLFSQRAAAEIKAFNPDARIIIMLREPTSMLYALYYAFLADGNEYLPTFKEALAAEDDRRAGHRLSRQTYLAQALVYRSTACYCEQVRRYFDTFGRERVHVIIYDDFGANTADIFRKTLEFLAVDPNYAAPSFEVINGNANGNECVRSRAVRAILNDPLVRGSAISLRGWLPHAVFEAVKKTGLKLCDINFMSSPSKRPPIDPELQLSLLREFGPEIERLSELLGRDLTHWGKPQKRDYQLETRLISVKNPRTTLKQTGFEAT